MTNNKATKETTEPVKLGSVRNKPTNPETSGRITIATPAKDLKTKVAWELFKAKNGEAKETQAFYKLWELAITSNPELFPTAEEVQKEMETRGLSE